MKTNHKKQICLAATLILFLAVLTACNRRKPDPEPEVIPKLTTSVLNISTTSVTCNVNIVSCTGDWPYPNGSRGICWSKIYPEPTVAGYVIFDISSSSDCDFTVIMDKLTPGTVYYVRAFAENTAGVGYGNTVEFSTSGNVTGAIRFNQDLTYGELTDIEGNTYKTIQVGTQTWMAENLKTLKFKDNTDIPNITDKTTWRTLTTPAYCWYLNDGSKYKNVYGALYNWYAVETGKLCPAGWHVPEFDEWEALTSFLGSDCIAGGKLRETGADHWVVPTTVVTNSSGMTLLPGGYREDYSDMHYPYLDDFFSLGYVGVYWTADEEMSIYEYRGRSWDFFYGLDDGYCGYWGYRKSSGLSVRCIKD